MSPLSPASPTELRPNNPQVRTRLGRSPSGAPVTEWGPGHWCRGPTGRHFAPAPMLFRARADCWAAGGFVLLRRPWAVAAQRRRPCPGTVRRGRASLFPLCSESTCALGPMVLGPRRPRNKLDLTCKLGCQWPVSWQRTGQPDSESPGAGRFWIKMPRLTSFDVPGATTDSTDRASHWQARWAIAAAARSYTT